MAILATGQPPPGVVQPPSNPSNLSPPLNPLQTVPQNQNPSYKSILNPNVTADVNIAIPAPTFDLHHGEPSFVWEDKIVDVMMRHEELHFAVIGKFSYGMPEFHELRKQIPLQCEIKGECLIGFLETRHVVIRLSCLEDYVHLLSRPAFSLKVGANLYPMRTMKYDVWFDPREETSIAVAWISFPGLPPAFFVKDAVFALASAVGKPLQLDAATKSKTRPSCAKVKVEVDLIATKPQRLRIGIKNSSNGEIRYKWIRIRYDFLPKYCKECRLQGHNEEECFSLHPELVSVEEVKAKEDHVSKNEAVKAAPFKVLQSGKIVGNVFKEGEGVAPVLTQGRQGKNSNKYLHPNRNPMAWTRVEKKTKQVTIDNTRINQEETVVLANAFATLDNVDVISGDVIKSTQQQPQVNSTQQESKDVEDSSEGGAILSPKSRQNGTRSWVCESFKDHPKVDAVGVSVKSGTGKSIEARGQAVRVLEAAREGEVDEAVRVLEESGSEAEGRNKLKDAEGEFNITAASHKLSGKPLNTGRALMSHAVTPSALLAHGNDATLPNATEVKQHALPSQNSPGHFDSRVNGNIIHDVDSRDELVEQLGSLCPASRGADLQGALDKIISSRLITNSNVESRGEEQSCPCMYGSPCEFVSLRVVGNIPPQSSCGISKLSDKINLVASRRGVVSVTANQEQSNQIKDGGDNVIGRRHERNEDHVQMHNLKLKDGSSYKKAYNAVDLKIKEDHAHDGGSGAMGKGISRGPRQGFQDEESRGQPSAFHTNKSDKQHVDLIKAQNKDAHGLRISPNVNLIKAGGHNIVGTRKNLNEQRGGTGFEAKGSLLFNEHNIKAGGAPKSSGKNIKGTRVDNAPAHDALTKAQDSFCRSLQVVNAGINSDNEESLSKGANGLHVIHNDAQTLLNKSGGLFPLSPDGLIPLHKLKLMTEYFPALPVIENTSQQEVPSNSMEMNITTDAAVDGNGQELPDPEDDEELLDYGKDDETNAASTENYEEDPADEYIGLRGLLSRDSSVNGDEFDNEQEAASHKNAVVEMPLDVGNASPGLSGGRLSEKELLRAAFYSSRSNNSQLVAKNFEPKPHLAHLVDKLPAQEVNIGEDDELDTESTAQNYVNAAANADLSPEKVAEHKKKLKQYRGRRDKSVPPTVGGRKSARISLSKTSGRQ